MTAAMLLLFVLQGQDPKIDWLKKNALAMKSIDPLDEDYSDLEPLRNIIGKARIVQLGEPSHGDGAAFHAKTRLIRFLHQKMGFDVLAFESGLFDCRKAWEKFRAGEDPVVAAQSGIFGIWTQSEEVRPLFEYLGKCGRTDRPLELAGFDCQFTARGSSESLLKDLEAISAKIKPALLSEEHTTAVRKAVESLLDPQAKPSAEDRERWKPSLRELRKALDRPEFAKASGPDEAAFWRQLAESIAGQAENQWAQKGQGPDATNLRDEQMAKNLLWLAEKRYPDRKMIVWAATFHIMRNPASIEKAGFVSYEKTVTMGHLLWKKLGDQVFTLGFTAHEGQAGLPWGNAQTLAKPPEGSLEDLCAKAGLENAIVSFRPASQRPGWLSEKIRARPLGYLFLRADWTQVLDGMVFTRRMFPSTMAAAKPDPLSPDEAARAMNLKGAMDTRWKGILELRGNFWEHKQDFSTEYDRWKQAARPDARAIAIVEEDVHAWYEQHKDEPGAEWRCMGLLGQMARDRKDLDAAAPFMDRALATFPDAEMSEPAKQSMFQHMVNSRAELIWDSKGLEAALTYACELLERERKFRFFFTHPWSQRLRRERKPEAMEGVLKRVMEAYEKRAKTFPDLAGEIGRFKASLK